MIPEYFALVGAALASLGGFYYLYCTIKGTVRPNKMTWFFWGLFPMIAFAAQISQGIGFIAWVTFVSGLTPFLIVAAASFNPDAYWKIQKRDYLFVMVAIVSVVLWQITDNPNLALTFALIADILVSMPTILKSYTNPETEDWHAFALSSAGFFLALLSVQMWTFENYAFVVYLTIMNVAIMLMVLIGQKRMALESSRDKEE